MSDQNLVWSDILAIEIIRTRLNVWQFLILSDHFRKVIIPSVIMILDNPPLSMMDTMCTFGFCANLRQFCPIGLLALLECLHIGEEDLGTRLHHKYLACSFVHVHTNYRQLSCLLPHLQKMQGFGVAQSDSDAEKWWTAAASSGRDPSALRASHTLGLFYSRPEISEVCV